MSLLGSWKRRRAERLFEKGLDLVEQLDYEAAMSVAERLDAMRFSGAFEITAQVQAAKGDLPAAVAVLEEGVTRAPGAWPNWQLLGNYRSDLELYDAAEDAYERALECAECRRDSVELNRAILALRRKQPERALELAKRVQDPDLAFRRWGVELDALLALDDFEAAATLAERLRHDERLTAEPGELAFVLVALAEARRALSAPKDEVRCLLLEAYRLDSANARAVKVLRFLDGEPSATAKLLRLLVHVRFAQQDPRSADAEGFYAFYDVVAEDVDDAGSHVERLEQQGTGIGLKIEEHRILDDHAAGPKGVVAVSSRAFYDERPS